MQGMINRRTGLSLRLASSHISECMVLSSQMEPLIADSVSRLLMNFEKAAESGRSVDVSEYFGRYTMEVILASAFGRQMDIQSSEERNKLTGAIATALGSIKETSTLDGALLKRWLCEWHEVHVSATCTYISVGMYQ